jgi:ribosomal protein RSM22 (predicted rRNA methylase)
MPARAAWRVSSPSAPAPLDEALREVLKRGNQNSKHLKLVHQSVIESHKALALRRDRERIRMIREQDYKKADEKRDAKVKPVLYGPEETMAAFKFRLFPNYSVTKRVLTECRSLIGRKNEWKPRNILDFGIGCGSASAAAWDVWGGNVDWVHGIDPSETMREGAQTFLETFCKEGAKQPRVTMGAHLSAELAPSSFDLALFVHTATELPHGASTLAAAALLWEKLLPDGIFVMIEPGTPDGFSSIRTVRNMLLDCTTVDSDGKEPLHDSEPCCIIAPCTHNGSCPMEQYQTRRRHFTQINANDSDKFTAREEVDDDEDGNRKGFCSFVQTMPGSNGSAKGEKFSYLVVQKRAKRQFIDKSGFDNAANVLARSMNEPSQLLAHRQALTMETRFLASDEDDLGLELLLGDNNRSAFGRIIRSPMKKKGHILIDCCTEPGRIDRQTISKSMSKQAPGVYAAARKSRWGGFWPVVDMDK